MGEASSGELSSGAVSVVSVDMKCTDSDVNEVLQALRHIPMLLSNSYKAKSL